MSKIIAAFENTIYENYVKGLFAIGCRPGELSALAWGDVDLKNAKLHINKSWSDRQKRIKSTKTGRSRTVPLSDSVCRWLAEIRPEDAEPEDLVCPSHFGQCINPCDFLSRFWKPKLKQIKVRYRPTYNARHTVWSHAIAQGMPVAEAAKYAGNSPETMIRHYLGSVTETKMPELF